MKKFFYCVIYALLCIHGAIASSEEKIKSRDVLEVELKVLVDDLWDIPGLEGKMGELIENLEKYVSENTRSVYKEIDYLDTLIRKWEIELEKKVNETNRYWKVINDEEERSSLLYYVVRRDNVYLDIINDMINKFDVNNSSHKKRFIAIMDPVFLHVNKNNEKIIELDRKSVV